MEGCQAVDGAREWSRVDYVAVAGPRTLEPMAPIQQDCMGLAGTHSQQLWGLSSDALRLGWQSW